jgi:hypothetical protein
MRKYLLKESLVGTISVYLILKKLMTPFSDWDAFHTGIIDKNGNKKRHPITSKERESWDILTRFCWNLKKIVGKFAGKSSFVQYFSAAYLLKDSINQYTLTNHELLSEELADISFKKQLTIFNILKDLPPTTQVSIRNQNLIEFEIIKNLQMVGDVLKLHVDVNSLFEDATVAADVAQHGQYLGAVKKENPMKLAEPGLEKLLKKKTKKKRTFKK